MRNIALALAVTAAGCGEAAPPDIGTTRTEIEAIVKQYHDKLSAGDIDGAAVFIVPEASHGSRADKLSYGKETVLRDLRGYIDIYKEKDLIGKRDAKYGRIEITQYHEVALARYDVTFLEKGKPFNEIYTQLFKRIGGKWMIIHEHRSAP
jgi:hypothetical protein